ncbi:hypothetical protein [Gluconacetobacter asukensis]|uniref:Uncharacterized protein n=1 Tax=Gluconacetobacter asukensis TaxID=1017181 RepID=A0A7W4IZ44_9PROT|nr:hypothetical protein [Gluconacetobacter asukensis]MBB2171755.1 hypothetical protein [Gluconacetobacter asukensis]
MLLKESLRHGIASAVSYAGRSTTVRNSIIGAGRAFDPAPGVAQTGPRLVVHAMTFDGGFAKDRGNLALDRMAGERKVFGKAFDRVENGKTPACA